MLAEAATQYDVYAAIGVAGLSTLGIISSAWISNRRGVKRIESTNSQQHVENYTALQAIHHDVRDLRSVTTETRDRVVRLEERAVTNSERLDHIEKIHEQGDHR